MTNTGNHWIKAAGFYPDYVTRLYNRKKSGYLERKAHSKVKVSIVVHYEKILSRTKDTEL